MYLDEADEIFNSLFERDRSFLSEYKKEEKINEILKSGKGLLFKPKEINQESLIKIKNTIKELQDKGLNLNNKFIGIDYAINKPYLTASDCEKLKEFESFIKNLNGDFVIVAEDLFYVDDIIITNSKLDAEVDYIKSLSVPTENNRPLTDLEKFLLVYDFCTNFKYKENEQNLAFSRNITSILNSTSIVCVGYAELMKEMCSRLGIECYIQSSTIYDKATEEELGGHANNLVILDGKLYYADACWDSQRPKTEGLKLYNHCLIPVKDKNHFKKEKVEYCDSCFSSLNQKKKMMRDYLTTLQRDGEIKDEQLTLLMWDYEHILKGHDFKSTIEWDMKTTPYEKYARLRDSDILKQQLEVIISYLDNYEYGEEIEYEQFEQALMNTYIAKGMSNKSAENLLERTLNLNEKRAQKLFDTKATNCFAQGKAQKLEI